MRRRVGLLLFVFFVAPATAVFSQLNQIDSLESLAGSLPADTTRVWILNRLVAELREKDTNKALRYALEAQQLAELLTYKGGLAAALEHQGWIYYRKGDYSKSVDLSLRALKLYESLNARPGMARCLINVAAIHFEQKQYDVAIDNFKEAYEAGKKLDDVRIMARSVNNIAYAYVNINQLDSAERYVMEALELGRKLNDTYTTAFALRSKGDVFLLRGDYPKALTSFEQCLKLAEGENITFLRVATLHRLGKVHKTIHRFDKAIAYLKENIEIASRFGYREELERTYKLLAETYEVSKDIDNAFIFQSKYLVLHDSLYDQKLDEQIALAEGKFSSEMKQVQIDLLTKDAELKSEEIERQKLWLYFSVGSLLLFILLVVALLYFNRANRIAKREAEKKNLEIEFQAEQLRKLNATKDKLFSIISHDLRSPLAGLKALMELVGTPGLRQDEFVNITLVLRRNLDSVHEDLDNLLLWAQTQLKGMQANPESFYLREIAEEKIQLFRETADLKNLTVENCIDETCKVFADRNHISIVLRNLLANAIKFNPTGGRVTIGSRLTEDFYEVSVSDSGVGISHEDIGKLFDAHTHFTKPGTHKEKGVGIGLLLTREFVEKNNGSIWLTSEVGKGTTFTFTIKAP
jgi:two-component system, sensor histidine kinase and response regulator